MNKEYKKRLDKALHYIDRNLCNKISLADIASASNFSAYHFHRIFTGVTGETVNDYVSRRRLECAVNALVFNKEAPVTQVALENGFSSAANFSKAVKIHFGFTPSEIRNPDKVKESKIGKVFSKYGKAFHPADLYPSRVTNCVTPQTEIKDTEMNVEIRELETRRVCVLASQGGYELDAVYCTWDKLIDWAVGNGIPANEQKRFAFAFDNPTVTPIDRCRYNASIVIDADLPVSQPFSTSEIPQGKYAVLHFKGDPMDAINAQLGIYSDWLPNSGFEPDDFPMLERYLNDARIDGFIDMEIHLKLKTIETK